MKKIITLLVAIGLLAGLVYLALSLSKNAKVSDDLSLIDFAVTDTASVNKIELLDTYTNQSFTVQRNQNGRWTDIEGNCVQQEIVHTMLNTFLKITLKGYVPKSAMETTTKLMLSNHKQVKIFQNDEWVKTWYVGHSTSDHYGTHMLLETPKVKSDNPVIMGMKGFYGILGPRFSSDPKMYRCSEMFSYKQEDIAEIEVVNTLHPDESFKIIRFPDRIDVSSNGKTVKTVNHENLLFYLNGFDNIHFNQPNYTLSEEEMDEMRKKTPDYKLSIKGKDQSNYVLKILRRPDPAASGNSDEIKWDPDYMWGVLPSREVVRLQYFVVGPLIFGKDIFVD